MSVDTAKKRLISDIAYYEKFIKDLEIEYDKLHLKISFYKQKLEDYEVLLNELESQK